MMATTVLLVGTQKGLFRVCADVAGGGWKLTGPVIVGYEVLHAWLDPRDQRVGYAAANHAVWGAHIYRTQDRGETWHTLSAVPHHQARRGKESLRAIWYLAPGHAAQPDVLYAGIDPAGLFVSRDRGESWTPIVGLNEHPTRGKWEPAKGGFSLHSIQLDSNDPKRLYAAVSAGGAFRSDDAGASWQPINRGVRAENRPERYPEVGHNIHRLVLHPGRPERLYRQCYNGTYRSDDRGEAWSEITAGLPSDFGYALAVDSNDPDTLFVVPEEGSHMRAPVDGKLRVYRSRDAGRTWQALTRGLPQEHVYVTVLREALAVTGTNPCGVYFGTSGGQLFASTNGGEEWARVAEFLPRILCVSAAVLADE
jgi:photosystem II stability/assembly factor-like uncharacterized protein